MFVFDDRDRLDLAWVLEYVAEDRNDDSATNTVGFAVMRVIECLR